MGSVLSPLKFRESPSLMKTACLSLLALLLSGAAAFAAFPTLALKPVCKDQLHSVTTITNAGDGSGRLFLTEQHGFVRVFKNGMLLPTPFLDISAKIRPLGINLPYSDESGLLGLAFHPDYENNAAAGYRKFYVYYMAASNLPAGTDPVHGTPNPVDCMTVVAEYQVSTTNADLADAGTERVLMTFNQPQPNHNGGQLEFGPDGFLYISSGDGGSYNDNDGGHTGVPTDASGVATSRPDDNLGNSQDKTRLLGKILRIAPLGTNGPGGAYGIPAANPFVGAGSSVREEIYAYGLRNPWRFSFDTGTGGTDRLFCADVGQDKVEEVNLIAPGANYGWHVREGTTVFSPGAPDGGEPFVDPIAQYAHPFANLGSLVLPELGISVVGGFVYRGSKITALQGKYVFGDHQGSTGGPATGILLGLEEPTSNTFTLSTLTLDNSAPMIGRLYTLGRGEDGELFTSTKTTTGPVQLSGGKPAGTLSKLVLPSDLGTSRYEAWRQTHGLLIGQYLEPQGDSDGDGIPNDVEYAYNYSPFSKNDPNSGMSVTRTLDGSGGMTMTMTFRRDAQATDLTYRLQISSDLSVWTDLATSIAGAAATGTGVSEAVVSGQPTFRNVTVSHYTSPPPPQQRFVRLQVLRAQ